MNGLLKVSSVKRWKSENNGCCRLLNSTKSLKNSPLPLFIISDIDNLFWASHQRILDINILSYVSFALFDVFRGFFSKAFVNTSRTGSVAWSRLPATFKVLILFFIAQSTNWSAVGLTITFLPNCFILSNVNLVPPLSSPNITVPSESFIFCSVLGVYISSYGPYLPSLWTEVPSVRPYLEPNSGWYSLVFAVPRCCA